VGRVLECILPLILCLVWSSILGTRKVLEPWIVDREARIAIRSQLLDPL
jgi:hypothetical protein